MLRSSLNLERKLKQFSGLPTVIISHRQVWTDVQVLGLGHYTKQDLNLPAESYIVIGIISVKNMSYTTTHRTVFSTAFITQTKTYDYY